MSFTGQVLCHLLCEPPPQTLSLLPKDGQSLLRAPERVLPPHEHTYMILPYFLHSCSFFPLGLELSFFLSYHLHSLCTVFSQITVEGARVHQIKIYLLYFPSLFPSFLLSSLSLSFFQFFPLQMFSELLFQPILFSVGRLVAP